MALPMLVAMPAKNVRPKAIKMFPMESVLSQIPSVAGAQATPVYWIHKLQAMPRVDVETVKT